MRGFNRGGAVGVWRVERAATRLPRNAEFCYDFKCVYMYKHIYIYLVYIYIYSQSLSNLNMELENDGFQKESLFSKGLILFP